MWLNEMQIFLPFACFLYLKDAKYSFVQSYETCKASRLNQLQVGSSKLIMVDSSLCLLRRYLASFWLWFTGDRWTWARTTAPGSSNRWEVKGLCDGWMHVCGLINDGLAYIISRIVVVIEQRLYHHNMNSKWQFGEKKRSHANCLANYWIL